MNPINLTQLSIKQVFYKHLIEITENLIHLEIFYFTVLMSFGVTLRIHLNNLRICSCTSMSDNFNIFEVPGICPTESDI